MNFLEFFQQSLYKIDGKEYSVPKIAGWAKKNLPLQQIPISQIQQKYHAASQLFIDVEEGEWSTRSMGTDLNYPILILQKQDGTWDIIDGNHRTWKAWKTGMPSINGYVISTEQLPPPENF